MCKIEVNIVYKTTCSPWSPSRVKGRDGTIQQTVQPFQGVALRFFVAKVVVFVIVVKCRLDG